MNDKFCTMVKTINKHKLPTKGNSESKKAKLITTREKRLPTKGLGVTMIVKKEKNK